ncbi:transglycosylase domain-containing protein [Clostridioides difficile]|uniref:transglycosylase domain-containing protein n=1 Tax=Clostridioides difficile TaxID=1496 RepID=UPI00103367F6|nr:transglycosylase domain-containing protein [Clostridioides difficile]MDM9944034.1 transglycosylase domain-containing protein [Clostridioides difficile]
MDKEIAKLKLKKVLKYVSILILAILIIAGVYIFIQVRPLLKESKKIAYDKLASINDNTFTLLENTKIYDRDNNLLKEIKANNYKYCKIQDVSKNLQNVYIGIEDRNFLSHNGIDYGALARAGVSLIKNKGHITQGGSTITQQVIKNMLLTQERSFKRKLIEFFLAPELERKYSKADIMEFYVNTNYFGAGCYGVYSAASYYFGKEPIDLTLSEATLLAGLSNNPSRFNPVEHREEALKKRNRLLSKLLEEKIISKKEYTTAINEEINLVLNKKLSEGKEDYLTSYAIYSTVLKLMELDGFKFKYAITDTEEYNKYKKMYTEEYTEKSNLIRSGGYTIHTSLDKNKQQILQETLDSTLKDFTEKDTITKKYKLQGASVLVNNQNGLVEAIVGGRGSEDNFNRGFLAVRQPGSTIKPIVDYGPAFETGKYYPSYIMEDKPLMDGKPKNSYAGYKGNMTLREALARSSNTIAYKLLLSVKPKTGLEFLKKMNFSTLEPTDNVGSLALGGITKGVRLVEMAKAYSTIANQGVYNDASCLRKVEFANTGTVYNGEVKKNRVFTEDTAYMLIDVLKDVLNKDYGTGKKAKPDNGIIAFGKTGTTNDNRDSCFSGGTTQYTLSTWVGYDSPQEIPKPKDGGSYSSIIWKNTLEKIQKGLPNMEFKKPTTIIIDEKNNEILYSKIAMDKIEAQEAENEKRKLVLIEKQWQEQDKQRQEIAKKLVSEYESLNYSSINDLEEFDIKYNETETAVSIISNDKIKKSLMERLETKKSVLDKERNTWSNLYEKQKSQILGKKEKEAAEIEEAKHKGKERAKQKLITEVRNIVDGLKVLNVSNSKKYYYVTQAEDAVERLYGYDEYNEMRNKLLEEKERLKINQLDTEIPQPQDDLTDEDNNF